MNAVQTHMHENETVKDLLIKLYTQRMSSSRVIIKLKFTQQWEKTSQKRRNKMHLPILLFVRFFSASILLEMEMCVVKQRTKKAAMKKKNETNGRKILEKISSRQTQFWIWIQASFFSAFARISELNASWMPTSKNALEPR